MDRLGLFFSQTLIFTIFIVIVSIVLTQGLIDCIMTSTFSKFSGHVSSWDSVFRWKNWEIPLVEVSMVAFSVATIHYKNNVLPVKRNSRLGRKFWIGKTGEIGFIFGRIHGTPRRWFLQSIDKIMERWRHGFSLHLSFRTNLFFPIVFGTFYFFLERILWKMLN